MKKHIRWWMIGLSVLALATLVSFQWKWMETARELEEQQLDHRVQMALCTAVTRVAEDSVDCKQTQSLLAKSNCSAEPVQLTKDSIWDDALRSAFTFYQIPLEYQFLIEKQSQLNYQEKADDVLTYHCYLGDITAEQDWSLILNLPQKDRYILGQISPIMFASACTILVVLAFFIWGTRSVVNQQRLAAQNMEVFNYVAHEMKTPLTNISLASKALGRAREARSEAKIHQMNQLIQQENQQLIQQVESLLNLNYLDQEANHHAFETVDIHEILDAALARFHLQVSERNGKLLRNWEEGALQIQGVYHQLLCAFTNLVDNAIKYSTGTPQLSVHTSAEKQVAQIVIGDRGTGILQEDRKKVFAAFYRSQAQSRRAKGFGLGLSLVKKIVDLHRGQINIVSSRGQGTRIILQFPYDRA